MKFATRFHPDAAGFTLAEALAAMLFLAIVVPVSLQALRVASATGQVAVRKAEAVRVAERVLNEALVTGTWNRSSQNGTVSENGREYRWTLRNDPWHDVTMRELTVEVRYFTQEREQTICLSTLVDAL